MNRTKAYEEIVDFIAAGTTPQNVVAFRLSEAAQDFDISVAEGEAEIEPDLSG